MGRCHGVMARLCVHRLWTYKMCLEERTSRLSEEHRIQQFYQTTGRNMFLLMMNLIVCWIFLDRYPYCKSCISTIDRSVRLSTHKYITLLHNIHLFLYTLQFLPTQSLPPLQPHEALGASFMPKAVLAASSWKVALAWFYAGEEGSFGRGSLRDPVMWVTLRDIVDTCWFLHCAARISWPTPPTLGKVGAVFCFRSFQGFPGWQKLFWELYCSEVPTVKTGNPNETCACLAFSSRFEACNFYKLLMKLNLAVCF